MSKLAVFDVFGTIYTPKASVGQQYSEVIRRVLGSVEISPAVLNSRFKAALKSTRIQYPHHGKQANLNIQDFWSKVIEQTLPGELRGTEATLVPQLYDHFASKEAYTIYPDVVPTLDRLKSLGFRLAVLSNSDSRTRTVLGQFGLLEYFDAVVLSGEIDFEKPSRDAYLAVLSKLNHASNELQNVWYVGDSVSKDYEAAIGAGWNAVLVDRQQGSHDGTAVLNKKPIGLYTTNLTLFPGFLLSSSG